MHMLHHLVYLYYLLCIFDLCALWVKNGPNIAKPPQISTPNS
jgi:hypothetical protein